MMDKARMSDEELFRQALIEAFARKIEQELRECKESPECSAEHIRKMESIIEGVKKSEKRKSKRKFIISLIAAAALLLSACTVYAYRGKIRNFVEKVYANYIEVTYTDGENLPENEEILESYTLGYIPEGYELVDESKTVLLARQKWTNSKDDLLIFEQGELDNSSYQLDSEQGETIFLICENMKIYYRNMEVHTYMWNDGEVSFKILSTNQLTEDVLEQIIRGIKKT